MFLWRGKKMIALILAPKFLSRHVLRGGKSHPDYWCAPRNAGWRESLPKRCRGRGIHPAKRGLGKPPQPTARPARHIHLLKTLPPKTSFPTNVGNVMGSGGLAPQRGCRAAEALPGFGMESQLRACGGVSFYSIIKTGMRFLKGTAFEMPFGAVTKE